MSLEQNSIILSELFEKIIMNPKIDVCTEELKGASVLDVNILRLLNKNDQLPIKKIGIAFGLVPSTLGSAIKRLEKSNLIERKINENDLRSYLICLTEHGKEVILDLIRVQEEKRGKGYGKWFMRELCRLADETRKEIKLTPSNELGSDLTRLIRFYQSFGFVSVGEEMKREPKC